MTEVAGPGKDRRRLWPVLAAALVIAALVAGAWILQRTFASGAESPKGALAPPYAITVKRSGAVLKTYDPAALHALPQFRVVIDGKAQTGPSLRALLKDAGAGHFASVDVHGAGLRDAGSLTLTAAQARQQVQLDFADRGTCKLCGPDLDHSEWVRDVLSIDVH